MFRKKLLQVILAWRLYQEFKDDARGRKMIGIRSILDYWPYAGFVIWTAEHKAYGSEAKHGNWYH